MLSVGETFPEFELEDQEGAKWSLARLKGERTVVYFYPKDDTSGCTVEACQFQEALPQFSGARVIGVSPDGVKSHAKFANKFGLRFVLLADAEHTLCENAGVWAEKSMYGRKYWGVERTTFLLDANAVVTHVWTKVKPDGHAAEVLAALS